MKVQLHAGATVDMLNRDELAHELKPVHEAVAWAREMARGLKHIDLPVLSGPAVTGGFVLGGRENVGGPPICGPNPGFYWKIQRVTVTGFTGGSAASVTAQGSVTSPAATAAITATPAVPAGVYMVNWTVGLAGTLAAGDANNMRLFAAGSPVVNAIDPPVAGTYPQAPVTVVIPAGGGSIGVQAIAAGSVGAIYSAQITATPVSAGAETAVCTLYKTSQRDGRKVTTIPLVGGTGVYHPGSSALILRPDDNLILAVSGTIASPAGTPITLTGEADEAPGPMVYKLLQ